MAATSLESQVIRGAYSAAAKDPDDIVGTARRGLSKTLRKGMENLAIQKRAKKEEEKLEAEKVEKEQKEQSKGYDNDWKKIRAEMDKNLGSLDIAYFNKANDHAKGLKETYDACPAGKEGDDCRRGVTFQLNQFVSETAATKKSMGDLVDSQNKFDSKELELSKSQTLEQKAILGQLDGAHASLAGSNDGKIAELTEQMKTVSGEEKASLQKQIEALENNSKPEYGWDISYEDELGNTIEKRVTKDMLGGLMPHTAKDVTVNFKKEQDGALEIAENLRTGAKGGKKYDLDKTAATHGESINEGNMKSVFKDPLYGGTETIEDHLRQNPVITNLNYADLGIEIPEMDEDGVIDPEEWAKLSPTDVDNVINEISNNEDLAKIVGGNYMALKTDRAVKTELYGDEYFPEPTGPNGAYTDKDRTLNFGFDENGVYKEGPTVYPTIQALQEAIEIDKTTIRGDWENETDLKNRGYIHGLAQSGTIHRTVEGKGVIKQSIVAPGGADDIS